MEAEADFIFQGSKITADDNYSHEIKRHLFLGRKAMTNLDNILKSRNYYLTNKGPSSQSYDFSSSHVWMWELVHKESWTLNNWCFWTVVLEKTLESPLDCKEIKSVNPKGNQSWISIGRTDAEAETPILWPPNAKNWLTGQDSDPANIEGRRRRGQQRMSWLDGISDLMDMSLSKFQDLVIGNPGVLQFMALHGVGHKWVNWIELIRTYCIAQWTLLSTLWSPKWEGN